ncbi:MAG: S41 family peptidase [Phycisphaeraceae bacterium]|nr:S41 family peptidase [Phycisphaeraceae bacterium]
MMRPLYPLLAPAITASGLFLSGCASPARPEFDHFTEEPVDRELNGDYVAVVHTRWIGPVYARMTAQRTESGFKANTDPRVAWSLVGGVEGFFGPFLAPFLFPSGMLVVWSSTLPDEVTAEVGEGWIGPSTVDPWRLPTRMKSAQGPVEIRHRDGRVLAVMALARPADIEVPATDYRLLTQTLQRVVAERYFDPALSNSDDMLAFFADLNDAIPHVRDDATYLAAIGLSWRKRPQIAMPMPYRHRVPESDRLLVAAGNTVSSLTVTRNEKTSIATVEVVSFHDHDAVDAAMREAISGSPAGIIIDLRNATGFDLSSLRLAQWLIQAPIDAGTVYNAQWRERLREGAPGSLPPDSARDPRTAPGELGRDGAVSILLRPLPDAYAGPVAVLTSARTRSSPEILAWLLQRTGRAKIVGERTAGRPRLSQEHDLGQGFVVRVDEFDWLMPESLATRPTPDQESTPLADRSAQIRPDILTSRQRAPARAARMIHELSRE